MSSRSAAVLVAVLVAGAAQSADGPAVPESWSFAVSGDSRDCGDLVMPKIARAVLEEREPAVDLYWHLGDFRRIYDMDCDMVKRAVPGFDCRSRPLGTLPDDAMGDYLDNAWPDFLQHQIRPFGALPVLLGIGNHELYGRSRDDFRKVFRPWLHQGRLHRQRVADTTGGIPKVVETSYRLVHKGVDLIYLDNADEEAFTTEQLVWLTRVLKDDARNDSVRAIVVGMHESLPYSISRNHAMDASCQGLCSGQQAYDLLYRAQNLAGPPEKQKRVYVLSSHSHLFAENIYDTPEHAGQVLPGWIIGTAGAVQTKESISYGYVRIDVRPDGTLTPRFREVTRTSLPLATGPGADSLTEFCFTENWRKASNDAFRGDCACGAARP